MAAWTASGSSPAFCGEVHRLGQALDHAGDADLVDHLGQLPGPGRPHQAHGLGIGRQHRLDPGEGRGVAARHDRQLAVLGARLSARHRGVDEGPPAAGRQRRHLARHRGRGGGVVDDHGALGQMRQGLAHHLAHVVVIAHAQDEQLGPRRRPGHGRRERPRPSSRPSARALSGERLKPVTSCPARTRCPAMGPPMTPSPANAIFTVRPPRCGRIVPGRTPARLRPRPRSSPPRPRWSYGRPWAGADGCGSPAG